VKKTLLAVGLLAISCTSSWATEFTCQLDNNKYVSVNVLAGKTPVYRYGTLSKVEIALPKNGSVSDEVFMGQMLFAQGGSIYLRFKTGDFNYVVYDGEGKGWQFKGLVVYQRDKIINKKECKGDNTSDLWVMKNSKIKEDPDSEKYGYAPSNNEQ
jgi:hypothetical protein